MKIGFIGAGKVGWTLGKYLSDTNEIIGFASRSASSAEAAASFTDSKSFKSPLELARECDLLFITTPDREIASTWNALKHAPEASQTLSGLHIAHCSGSLSSQVFEGTAEIGAYAYSVHPLFAISSKTESYRELSRALFTIEGSPEHLDEITALFKMEGNAVQAITAESKTRYHAAAVMASNQVIALYRLAAEQLQLCGFSPEASEQALAPLFLGNAEHLAHSGAVAALTGPAERGDTETIERHLHVLEGAAHEVYRLLNDTLMDIAEEKHRQ